MSHILIGVLSARQYEERRAACMATWFRVNPSPDIQFVFIVGNPVLTEPRPSGLFLECPCPDDYGSLSQKTRWFFQWGLSFDRWTHLMKCDDDTYIAVDRLIPALTAADYTGAEIGGYAQGGAGYILSPRAARIVANNLAGVKGSEDTLVGAILSRAGIPLTIEPRFIHSNKRWPERWNDLITSHQCTPARMREIHRALYANPSD